jgi:hypothetical protein
MSSGSGGAGAEGALEIVAGQKKYQRKQPAKWEKRDNSMGSEGSVGIRLKRQRLRRRRSDERRFRRGVGRGGAVWGSAGLVCFFSGFLYVVKGYLKDPFLELEAFV